MERGYHGITGHEGIHTKMKDCIWCGRVISERLEGCVGIDLEPGKRIYYHPACHDEHVERTAP